MKVGAAGCGAARSSRWYDRFRMPLVTLDRISIAFGHLPLLDHASLRIEPRERVCVIGRNGTGKSTLLQIVSGDLSPQDGTVRREPGAAHRAVGAGRSWCRAICALSTWSRRGGAGTEGDAWQRRSESEDGVVAAAHSRGRPYGHAVRWMAAPCAAGARAGRGARSAPARRTDQPSRHRDDAVAGRVAGRVCGHRPVRHPRSRVSAGPGDADRRTGPRKAHLVAGRLRHFLKRKEESLAVEEAQDARSSTNGLPRRKPGCVKASRRGGRATRVASVRCWRCVRNARPAARRSVRSACEPRWASAAVRSCSRPRPSRNPSTNRPIVIDFSVRVMRGDRIGLIGSNGCGKTTLIKLLLGQLEPDAGRGAAWCERQDRLLRSAARATGPRAHASGKPWPTATTPLRSTERRSTSTVIFAIFCFRRERALSPVKALSGGERNRLLLARLFARPFNVLVMDEPTNDLDIETLELLEERLATWPGTLMLVSHDRAFIDHVVTSTLVFEGERASAGVHRWVRGLAAAASPGRARAGTPRSCGFRADTTPSVRGQRRPRFTKAFLQGAARARATTGANRGARDGAAQLQADVSSADFYKRPAAGIHDALARLEELETLLLAAYARWDALDSRAEIGAKNSG